LKIELLKILCFIKKYFSELLYLKQSNIILTVLVPFFCVGQQIPGNIQFNHFSADHGLSQTVFESILQDSKGYIWFGTLNGLIKYDGYTFTSFAADQSNKNLLASDFVKSLSEDKEGNIWAGGDGLSKYDLHTGRFTNWSHDTASKYSLPSNNVTCLKTDKQGRLWVGTGDAGLCYYEKDSNRFVNISEIIHPDSLNSQSVRCMMTDHNGLLWIGTSDGINVYDPTNRKLKRLILPGKDLAGLNKAVTSLVEDQAGKIWISLWNSGICRYDPATGNFKTYRHSASDPSSLGSDMVRVLLVDSYNRIWAGTTFGGLSIYQPSTDNFRTWKSDVNDIHSLGTNEIENLFEDAGGVLWIGTGGAGLNNCYLAPAKFFIYQNWDKDYITHRPTSLYKNSTGKIYMTTRGAGLQEFDPVAGKFISHNIVLPNDSLGFENVSHGTVEASDGNFWMIGYAEALHSFDLKTKKFTSAHIASNQFPNSGNACNCIVEDGNKRLWIGTNHGLKCYNLKTRKFSGFEKIFRDTNQLSTDGIADLYFDPESVLWIAGSEGGLTLFNTITGEIKVFRHDENNPNSINNNTLNYFFDDNKGKVWIGTNAGLSLFDKKSQQFIAFTVKDGLPDNSIRGILSDGLGNLWLSSNKGICKFTPPSPEIKKPVCRNYNMSDGLPGDEFGFNASVKSDDGILYFAGSAGLVGFDPEDLKDNPYIPPVAITDFSIFNKSILPGDSTGILPIFPDEAKVIELSYRQNAFSFTFSALSYIHPEKNQYAYMLQGFDKDWIYTHSDKRFANYTNLNAGTYTFMVKASNNDGLWNEQGATVKLIIRPPYWQTWWFRLLCLIVLGIILYSVYHYRMQKFREILRIRNKIASDLHDDLGATLSSISIMSELVNQQIKDHSPQSSSLLEKIGISSRNMIESVNDMVWAINPKNDSFENIIKRMRTFGSEILAAKDIAFHFDFDRNLLQSKLKMDMRRDFYLVFKEAVNNVAKYSGAANAFVMIWNRDNNLKMTIRDDGNGFDLSSVRPGNGLLNMQQRAEGMKAFFNVESIPGKGTTIELEFKND